MHFLRLNDERDDFLRVKLDVQLFEAFLLDIDNVSEIDLRQLNFVIQVHHEPLDKIR